MKKAFTLIELIATIVILGVVTSVVSILIMNVIRNAKDSANKRSIDNYGRIVETSMAEYQSQYLKYPDSIEQLEIEYVGSVIECETRRINPDKTIYLSECKVNGKKVLDKSTEDGYYHYGTLVLTNEEYVDKLGNNIELALKDYYEENNKYPVNYRLLELPKLDKEVNCVSKIHQDGTVYLTKCSIDGSYIMNENEEDGYYHYGRIYDYIDKDGKGYNEVEYLESTGTQYIDTGVRLNQDSRIEMKMNLNRIENCNIFGSRTSATQNNFSVMVWQNGQFGLDFDNYEKNRLSNSANNDVNQIEISKDYLKINSVVRGVSNYSSFETPNNAYIFDISGNPASGFLKSKMRLYYLKIYDNSIILRDYVPTLDSTDRPCLFDRVTNKCYYNSGTGEFYYPIMKKTVNYIESTGTQYIDTGVRLNQDSRIEMKMNLNIIENCNIFGSRTSATQNNFSVMVWQNGQFGLDFDNYEKNRLSNSANNDVNQIEISKDYLKINSVVRGVSNYSNFETPNNAYIFDISGNPASGFLKSKMRLYYLKIYNSDDIIRYFIPILDDNNIPCLYDKVEKKCYYNQGTGEFLYG